MPARQMTLTALRAIPMVKSGDDLASLIVDGMDAAAITPSSGDILIVASKIVSKAQGRFVRLASVAPSARANVIAQETGKDARLVELILSESKEVLRVRDALVIVEHRLGYVMANAGIDQSNVAPDDDESLVLLLPVDPDGTCSALKADLDQHWGVDLGILISDSFGRAWRRGVTGVALGAAGVPSLINLVGKPDLFGRKMRVTEIAIADQLAAAATLMMGEADEGCPIVHIRGAHFTDAPIPAATLIRPKALDLFR